MTYQSSKSFHKGEWKKVARNVGKIMFGVLAILLTLAVGILISAIF
jgi:hypothetical protein